MADRVSRAARANSIPSVFALVIALISVRQKGSSPSEFSLIARLPRFGDLEEEARAGVAWSLLASRYVRTFGMEGRSRAIRRYFARQRSSRKIRFNFRESSRPRRDTPDFC